MCTIGSENDNGGENEDFAISEEAVVESPRVKKIESTQDTLTGVFKDKDGRDGYMVVNYTEPSAGLVNNVRMYFNDFNGALLIENGEQRVVTSINGYIEFSQNSGDGTFVIPLR